LSRAQDCDLPHPGPRSALAVAGKTRDGPPPTAAVYPYAYIEDVLRPTTKNSLEAVKKYIKSQGDLDKDLKVVEQQEFALKSVQKKIKPLRKEIDKILEVKVEEKFGKVFDAWNSVPQLPKLASELALLVPDILRTLRPRPTFYVTQPGRRAEYVNYTMASALPKSLEEFHDKWPQVAVNTRL
jgi:hypothetical protein